MSEHKIYLVPGVATDRRVYRALDLQGRPFEYLDWLEPEKKETIEHYAERMAERVDPNCTPVILGYSFGGMVSIEMAKLLNPTATIVMASIKHYQERPMAMFFMSMVGLHRAMPSRIGKRFAPIYKWMNDPRNEDEHFFIENCVKDMCHKHTDWALHQAINWRNEWQPRNLHHIHGTDDRIFPYRYIKNAIPIQGGSHLMMLNRSEEINQKINQIIDRVVGQQFAEMG